MGARFGGIAVLAAGTFCLACAAGGNGDGLFLGDQPAPDSGGLDSGGIGSGSTGGSIDDGSGDDAASSDDGSSATYEAGLDSPSSESGSCNAPACAACLGGSPCCTTAGACGCPFLTLCL